MYEIFKIAQNSFRETIRNKILYNILFFALIFLIISYFISQWSVLSMSKVITDFSLGIISIFGFIITIFLGINLIFKEIDKKTIYVIVSKPISRWIFIFGKFLGLSFTMFFNTFLLTVAAFCVMKFHGIPFNFIYLKAVYLIYLSFLIVLAIAFFFSSFSTPFVSSIFTLIMLVSGKLSYDIFLYAENMSKKGNVFLAKFMDIIYYVVPNLENFNISNNVSHNLDINNGFMLSASIYGMSYTLFFLILAAVIFEIKEFK